MVIPVATERSASGARSIAWHLGLICLLLVLPATMLYGWILWQYAQAERERLVQEGLQLTREVAEVVERELASIIGTARFAVSSPRLTAGNLDVEAERRTLVLISQALGVDIVVRDPAGRQLINTRLEPDQSNQSRPLDVDRIAAEAKQPVVSDLFEGAVNKIPLVAVVAPLFHPGTDVVAYFMDFTIHPERIRDIILRKPPGEGMYVMVLDRKGKVIARTREQERFVGTEVAAFQGLTKREGFFAARSLDDVPILVHYTRLADGDWTVAVGLEESALKEPVWRLVAWLALAGLCLGLLSVTLAYAFGRRITEAIRSLSTAAASLGRGGHVPVLKTPIEEVNQVGAALVSAAQERKRAEEIQTLMVRELHHRVKNTLATVQAVVSSTARTAETISEFREAVTDRIGSLAKTHTLLVNNAWGGAALQDILWAELAPYEAGQNRVRLSGPELHVPDDVALAFGMAVHELTTNAAKYGSLSLPTGHLDVTWAVTGHGPERRLVLEWLETKGPTVQTPQRRGFGSMLLERVLGRQLQGEVSIDYLPEGLRVRMDAPLPQRPEAGVQ